MQKCSKYSLVIAAAILTACQFDTVALDDSAERPNPLDELPQVAASSSGGFSSTAVIDNTRPRFRVGISSSGALTPGASVTVTLHGEAVERVPGGLVSVILPTMASMDHAGAGKRPYLPAGQGFPIANRWTLSAMSPGDTWRQSFTLTLPAEEGYYDFVVAADIHANREENPFVDNQVQFERWMLVKTSGGGGHMGIGFDESVFADGIAPVPGPFRDKAKARASSGSTAGVGMDSDDVFLSVKYPGNPGQGMIAAVGAKVKANLYSHGNDGEQLITTYTRTVSSTGIVSFPCPGSNQWYEGWAELQATTDINGKYFVNYWDADSNDCGDTFDANGSRYVYLPWKNLKAVTGNVRGHFGVSPFQRVDWTTNLSNTRSHYNPDTHQIVFGSQSYDNKWTAAHEYAHAMNEKAMNGTWSVEQPACQTHDLWIATGYRCALLEGFADYAGTIGAGWGPTFETAPDTAASGPRVEGHVAALFRDLIDGTGEEGDETDYTSASVGTAFSTCERRVGGGSWHYRTDVSQLVWCLENRINSQVHNTYFTTPVPSAVRATRGSGWNANDIRDTWTHNLGS